MSTRKRNAAVILGLITGFSWIVTQPNVSADARIPAAAAHGHPALAGRAAPAINCPAVAPSLPEVPAAAKAEVDRNLALLDTQIAEANRRLASSANEGGPNFVQNAILGPLADKRTATINRIATAIGRVAERPAGLDTLATCSVADDGAGGGAADPAAPAPGDSAAPAPGDSAAPAPEESAGAGEDAGAGEAAPTGPAAGDFVDIRQVQPAARAARAGRNGSRGTFVSRCGNNANGHRNPDNFIVAPGVSNGAKHTHDYVGNLSTDGFSTDESLQAAGTTCRNGDKSTYFWPVLRDQSAGGDGGDGNIGRILTPSVRLEFSGNAQAKVAPMPTFMRAITGDAKVLTNGVANARAQWTCTGFTNRITDKYPICPGNSRVMRILEMPSCLVGNATDSPNHRTHILFPDKATGACPAGSTAVPKLTMTLTYRVANERTMAVDSFPEQLHNPATDHADFANVMPANLMNRVVSCINRGQRC